MKDLGNNQLKLDTEYLGVNKQGTQLEFSLNNISQIEAAVGPLQVSVKHRDDEATLPYEILVGTELSIIDVTPNNGAASDKIEIKGIGFSNKIADNTKINLVTELCLLN